MIGYSLSLSDMLLVQGFKEAFGNNDQELIKQYLYDNGLDSSLGLDEVVCEHRNLRGQIVNCLRWEAHERADSDWMQGDGCSWENKVEHSSLDMRIQLKTMGKMLNTGDFCTYAQKHGIQSDN